MGPPTSLTSDWGRAAISAGQFFRLRTLGTLARIRHKFARRPVSSHRLLFCWRHSPSLFHVVEAFYCPPFEALSLSLSLDETRATVWSTGLWTMLAPRYRRPRTLGGRRTTIIRITLKHRPISPGTIDALIFGERTIDRLCVKVILLWKKHPWVREIFLRSPAIEKIISWP